MKKTKEQKKLIRKNKMIPVFWILLGDAKNHMVLVNVFTGECRLLDK